MGRNSMYPLVNRYEDALKLIRDTQGKVCEQYEICEHESCKSSYDSWAIADATLKDYPRTNFDVWKFFTLIALAISIVCILYVANVSERQQRQRHAYLMLSKELGDEKRKVEQLEKLRIEFDTYKVLTSDEFERTWRSFATIRNNFLSLGHGFHLGPKDVAPEGEYDESEIKE